MPQTRTELIEYAKRQLGHPVIELNLADEQIEDCVNDAIQYYREYHMDGITRDYYSHQISESDAANKYITLPESILFIVGVVDLGGAGNRIDPLLSTEYQLHANNYFNFRGYAGFDATSLNMFRENLDLMKFMVRREPQISYSRIRSRIYFHDFRLVAGNYVVIECYRSEDPEEYPKIYNQLIIKRHVTALMKKQWGQNLSKFEGLQLMGGVTFNGRQILDDANTELLKIEEEYELKYSEPTDFFIG
jgi:hypothetical protein